MEAPANFNVLQGQQKNKDISMFGIETGLISNSKN